MRRGQSEWPTNAELVDPKKAEDLLEKATRAAEEAAKVKKKDGDEEDVDKKKSGSSSSSSGSSSVMWDSSSYFADDDAADEVIGGGIAPVDAVFENLKDGSKALILKPGFRLKLKLSELLEGGDALKEERKKKALRLKKKKEQRGKSGGGGGSVWDYDASDTKWSRSKWFKENINEYTITIDMKILDEIPRSGLGLFQTALIHAKENKRSGKTTLSRSDGECIINQGGGVGMFGTFGDTTKAKLEVGQWKRVVVAVHCVDGQNEKGEMRTWVNTDAGVVLKEESIVSGERFSIDPDGLFLFSSAQESMMPGNIAIRTVRVEQCFATDADVKSNRARDKVQISSSPRFILYVIYFLKFLVWYSC